MTTPLERDSIDSFDPTTLRRACVAAFNDPNAANEIAVGEAAMKLVRAMRLAGVPPERMLVVVKTAMSLDDMPGRHDERAARKWELLVQRAVRGCIGQYYSPAAAEVRP